MNLPERFSENWKHKFSMIDHSVLLAVSGGLDSMVMAALFLHAKLPFAIAHCNFGLRGEESDGDEAFVKNWCLLHSISFFVRRFETKNIAAASGTGIQETARDLRYEWFEEVRAENKLAAICTAHHAGDVAETMLINLCRGTGIAGLHGIPERNGNIVRPLLFATRQILQQYTAANNIEYREDSSNNSDDYLRNAIRHQVVPVLETLMPGATQRMLDTGRRLGEAEQLYKKVIESERRKLVQRRGQDYYIPVKLLKPRTPLATLCYEFLSPFGFTSGQIPFIVDLLTGESGKFIASPTHRIIRNRDFLIVTATQQSATDLILIEDFEQKINTSNGVFQFSRHQKHLKELNSDELAAYIDASKLEHPLLLRRWKTGDYFYPLGMGMKKKKLSRFLIDQKVPLHEKEKVWVLESNKRIVWVAGLRLDERFKIKPDTTEVLRIIMH